MQPRIPAQTSKVLDALGTLCRVQFFIAYSRVYNLRLLEHFQHLTVCLVSGFHLEQLVHSLEWDSLGLWKEEEHKGNRQEHEACEEHVHTIVHLEEHLRSEAGD